MANTFPTTLNSYTGSETLSAAGHAAAHNALESKVGVDGSAVTTSHDYKLSGVTGSDKAASKAGAETLTNKTIVATSNTISALAPSNFTTAAISQWTNDSGFITSSSTDTLTNKTLNAAKIASGGFIADANGNELIKFTTTTSAVNEVTFANAATGNNPTYTASGGDSNVGIDFKVKGTGAIRVPKTAVIQVFGGSDDVVTGDGAAYITIPKELNGMNLTSVHARVITAGTTNTLDVQIHNVTDGVDMLSTKLTIDSTETGSDTAASAAVINTSNDDVATNDLLRIDIDAVQTTKPKGLIIQLGFALP